MPSMSTRAAALARTLWARATQPLREARPCRREQLGYRCHSYLPQGCEACGRTERRPIT